MDKPLTILLVEDNPHNRMLFATALREHGHQVFEAPSGEKALLLGSLHEPDLILLDIGLPGVSGLGVATELRARPEFSRCPIIAVTAQRVPQVDLELAGIDHMIQKPVNPFELAGQVSAWWQAREQADRQWTDPVE
jgi:CheY-like chemotaxis protein